MYDILRQNGLNEINYFVHDKKKVTFLRNWNRQEKKEQEEKLYGQRGDRTQDLRVISTTL